MVREFAEREELLEERAAKVEIVGIFCFDTEEFCSDVGEV